MTKQGLATTARSADDRVQLRLLTLYDDLAEFQDQCSFLCDAFASIVTQEEIIDRETVRGASIYAQWIKERVKQMKEELKPIYEEVSAQGRLSGTVAGG